jgi:hypothetical protein
VRRDDEDLGALLGERRALVDLLDGAGQVVIGEVGDSGGHDFMNTVLSKALAPAFAGV